VISFLIGNFRVYLGRFENMMAKLLARSIQLICAIGMVFGMATAMAQDASVVMHHAGAVDGEHVVVVAYSDPAGEVGNGIDPPMEINNFPEADVVNGMDPSMEINNFPEGEVTNGMDPPK
jgi:hypothetical protein